MKDPLVRTKVALRHLPPTLSQSVLMEQIDARFAGRYRWVCFRQGKSSQKHQKYSRAYIDFRRPEDVVEFAEFFDGHVFVNEKGTQVKATVEYAPSQRVPKSWCKKDGREGSILKDPEYLEFLEQLAKPIENLPSAEIQLEKREAERAGAGKEPLIVTPLMDFVRQKRAAKSGTQRLSSNGKLSRRAMGASPGNSRLTSSKQGSEKRRGSTSMYVKRDSIKSASGKEKTNYIPRRDDPPPSDKSHSASAESGGEVVIDETGAISGASGAFDLGKKKVLLLKGKEREITQSYAGSSQQQNMTASVRNSSGSSVSKHGQRREVGGMIRSILINKEARPSQSSTAVRPEQQFQTFIEKDKRPPRSASMRSMSKEPLSTLANTGSITDSDGKRAADVENEPHGSISINEKKDRRTRNKDRPDRSVWSHRRSIGSQGSDETLSLTESLENMSVTHHSSATGVNDIIDSSGRTSNFLSNHLDTRDVPNSTRSGEGKTVGNSRGVSLHENGSHRHVGRRGPAHMKDADATSHLSESKPSKRGGATGYGPHEKQVWVQKSGSAS